MNPRAEIVVDLAAIRHNVRALREVCASGLPPGRQAPAMMTVVKADAYGHGVGPVARAAREAGADWLGVTTPEEALEVRESGDTGPLLSWLAVTGDDYAPILTRDVDVAAYGAEQLGEIDAAARAAGVVARVHLKIDTGLSRGGCAPEDWPALCALAADLERAGSVRIVGIWSHLACSDDPTHPANAAQEERFVAAVEAAEQAGLRPEVRHLANSAAAILRPSSRFDLVRCGIASYGLDPAPDVEHETDLVPAMTARARLGMTRHVEAGAGVSYGWTWTAPEATTLGLVPVGYGDGIPRSASSSSPAGPDSSIAPGPEVAVRGHRRPIRGRICMDQFVIDLGGEDVPAGTRVEIFGTGARGGPTATEWARRIGTINYEIVTRIGGRFTRTYVDSEEGGR